MQVSYNFRLEEDLKNKAFGVIESFGLTPAQAFRLFLQQTAETNSLPLSFDYKNHRPNAKTADAIRQGRLDYENGKLEAYDAEQAQQLLLSITDD